MVLLGKSVLFVFVASLAASLTAASTIPPSIQTTSTPPPTTSTTALPMPTTTTSVNTTTTEADADTTAAAASENGAVTTSDADAAVVDDDATTSNVTETSVTGTDENAPTTTAAPQPPFLCFDCNSGSPMQGFWKNKNCTIDGNSKWWNTVSPCNTSCYSSVGRYPAGVVFRGCATVLYLNGQNLKKPCFDDHANKRYVCLCSGDKCNTHNMTMPSQAYVDQHWLESGKIPGNGVF